MNKALALAAAVTVGLSTTAVADNGMSTYHISVTNVTKGIQFTPFLAAAHAPGVRLYTLGTPASEEIIAVAEAGDTLPLQKLLEDNSKVLDLAGTQGLLNPGESVDFKLMADTKYRWRARFSMASMLLPTNDTFVSLNGVRLPTKGSISYFAYAYDAGGEPNDELCVNIPGPSCGGEGGSPTVDGEGYVYPAPGIHGEGDLSVAEYGWSGPVAKVTITRY